MNFEPKPHNDFPLFIDTYFQRCRKLCPKLIAAAAKWTFEDLIPGLSDFDTRFIFSNDVTLEEWAQMSLVVGRVHTKIAREFPQWARILEHLPGLDLTYKEITDPLFYYPEFQQWTYYKGDKDIIDSINSYLVNKPWSKRDEYFHLKKFAIYYGPYLRGIDPPVNLGKYENKYPLHSRFMHYFTPPVQSAISIIRKKGVRGKFDALRTARKIFPNPKVIDMIFDAVEKHYEIPAYYQEPKLTKIDEMLKNYLADVYAVLADHITLIEVDPTDTPEQLKAKAAAIPIDPVEQFYEGTKFCRFMKGRLLFYAENIDWFDSDWLIRNELGRIVDNFYEKPLIVFGLAQFGEKFSTEHIIKKLRGSILSDKIADDVKHFAEISKQSVLPGKERELARKIADVIEPVNVMVNRLSKELRNSL